MALHSSDYPLGDFICSVQDVCHPEFGSLRRHGQNNTAYLCALLRGPRFSDSVNHKQTHLCKPISDFPIDAATMRLRGRAIFPLVRTTSTSAASSPPTAALSVGRALRERRRFTEDDVAAYAAVSGDRNPVHLDDAAARDLGGFQRGRVVHGMLVASLFPSIIAASFVRTLLPLFFPAFRRTARERGVSQSAFASWFGWFSLELCTRTRRSSSRRRCTLEMRWLLEFRR